MAVEKRSLDAIESKVRYVVSSDELEKFLKRVNKAPLLAKDETAYCFVLDRCGNAETKRKKCDL